MWRRDRSPFLLRILSWRRDVSFRASKRRDREVTDRSEDGWMRGFKMNGTKTNASFSLLTLDHLHLISSTGRRTRKKEEKEKEIQTLHLVLCHGSSSSSRIPESLSSLEKGMTHGDSRRTDSAGSRDNGDDNGKVIKVREQLLGSQATETFCKITTPPCPRGTSSCLLIFSEKLAFAMMEHIACRCVIVQVSSFLLDGKIHSHRWEKWNNDLTRNYERRLPREYIFISLSPIAALIHEVVWWLTPSSQDTFILSCPTKKIDDGYKHPSMRRMHLVSQVTSSTSKKDSNGRSHPCLDFYLSPFVPCYHLWGLPPLLFALLSFVSQGEGNAYQFCSHDRSDDNFLEILSRKWVTHASRSISPK